MYIISKSAINREQLIETVRKCSKNEIQLFKEFENYNDCVDDLYNTIISVEGLDIRCVHSPLIKGIDLNIEYVWDQDDYFMLERTVVLASKLAVYYGHEVKVIFHTELSKRLYEKIPCLYEAIRNFVQYSLSLPGNLIICIENVIPFKITKDNDIFFRNGTINDNIVLVKQLREDLQTDRVRTVLDTCHMITTIRSIKKLFVTENEILDYLNYEYYFQLNAPYIGLIHLCDVIGLGTNPMTHGIAFEEERLKVMEELMSYYKKYGYECDVTLEIQERDYTNKVNLESDFGDLTNVCNKLGIVIEN